MMATARPQRTALDRALIVLEVLAGIGVVLAIIGKTYGVTPTLFFILAALAVAFSGWAFARALLALRDPSLERIGKVENTERAGLEHEKRLLLHGIKELEVDLSIGKVDPRDYAHLRRTAEARAIAIIQQLKDQDAHWMSRAEDLVHARLGRLSLPVAAGPTSGGASARAARAPVEYVPVDSERAQAEPADARLFDTRPAPFNRGTAGLTCGGCGAKNDDDSRYCIACGRPRAEEITTP